MCLFYGKHKVNHSYYFFSCKYALPAQNACSLTENHRDFRSNKKRHLKARLLSVSFYGDEGNRTPVRNSSPRTSTSVVTVLTFPPPNTQ